MTARVVLSVVAALVALAAVDRLDAHPTAVDEGPATCSPARVNLTPYPGRDSFLRRLPWVRGEPKARGLVGLLWYWPFEWQQRRIRTARIFTGGVAPGGYSTKILWVFFGRSRAAGARLTVRGRQLDGEGRFTQSFGAISYSGQGGAPSYASIVNVPSPGCWRLTLSSGSLRASVVFEAVSAPEEPTPCSAGEVETLVGRFVAALNDGRLDELDAVFAQEPDFEWYSTDAPGERFTPLANDRPSLVPYFRDRHALGEQLILRSFRFNGNATSGRPYGNFVYRLTRSADDFAPTPYGGKGAALCYRNRSDLLFVWTMSRH